MNFSELNLSEQMRRGLIRMGFDEATPVQEVAISPMLEGLDLLVQSPTGSGKTAAFGIPVIEAVDIENRNVQAVVLCPTRELAIQTAKVLFDLSVYKKGVRIVSLYGGENIGKQMAAIRKKPQIVVATPGRLMDHIRRRTIKLGAVCQIVMDEADRMLDMGFRGDMDTILESVPDQRQTVLFSATLSGEILRVAQSYQTDAKTIKIGQEIRTVDSVEQFYIEVAKGAKDKALGVLLDDFRDEQALVFAGTKLMADALSERLTARGVLAEALHGGMRQSQRDKVMARFRKGDIRVLVATDVAARGIDVKEMGLVINYDIPANSDDYVHRIGRTGRANETGQAYTLIYVRERAMLKLIMDETNAPIKAMKIPGVSSATSEYKRRDAQNRQRDFERKPKSGAAGGPSGGQRRQGKNGKRPAGATKNPQSTGGRPQGYKKSAGKASAKPAGGRKGTMRPRTEKSGKLGGKTKSDK